MGDGFNVCSESYFILKYEKIILNAIGTMIIKRYTMVSKCLNISAFKSSWKHQNLIREKLAQQDGMTQIQKLTDSRSVLSLLLNLVELSIEKSGSLSG